MINNLNDQPQLTNEQQVLQNIQQTNVKRQQYFNLVLNCMNKVQELNYNLDNIMLSDEVLYNITEEIIQTNFEKCATKYIKGEEWKL